MDRHAERGFTLLELLTVIAIMAMLSMLAVTSYFGAVRGMARRSALKHLANTLVLARQRACMEGARMSVMIFNDVAAYDGEGKEIIAPSYVICKGIGRITHVGGGGSKLYDEFTDLGQLFGYSSEKNEGGDLSAMRLYNLESGRWMYVRQKVFENSGFQLLLSTGDFSMPGTMSVCAFAAIKDLNKNNSASFHEGDPYGIEVTPVSSLPRGFRFKELGDKKSDLDKRPICVTFSPDGSSNISGAGGGGGSSIVIEETLQNVSSSIDLEGDGTFAYDGKWGK